MSFSKRQGNDVVCYTKPLDSMKSWNDRFFWVDAFAVLPPFRGILAKARQRTLFPILPNIMRNIMLPSLCIRILSTKMDLLSFIRTADPTKVKVGERQRNEGELKLSDTTIGRVPLLPVAPARASSELEASVDRIFDKGGGGSHAEQGDYASGGHGVGIQQVSETTEIVAEDAAPVQPRHQRKSKMVVSDAGEPSHPLRIGVAALSTLSFITSSVSVTLEREDGDQTDFMVRANLQTITSPPRFVISSNSSHHSGVNIVEAEADSFSRPSVPLMIMTTTVTSTVDPTTTAKEKFAESSIFCGSSSSRAEHTVGGFFGLTSSDFIVGDDGRTCREMVDEFAPPKFFASIREMEHDELFTEFNVGAARQISLSVEVRIRAEFNIREKRRLGVVVEEKNSLLKARDEEVTSLKAQLLVKEAEAARAIRLRAEVQTLTDRNTILEREKSELDVKVADLTATVRVREQEVADLEAVVTSVKVHNDNLSDQVHTLEVSSAGLQEKVTVYENFIGQLKKFQDDRMREMNEKIDKLDTDLVELALHLEERFYPHLLTTISGRRWLLTHGLELAIAKCLNSTEYLSSLGAAIGKAVEKGMQEGLSAGITHGAAGRVLTDVAAYNPSAEADYLSALQRLQSVNFSLITELKSNKDASIDTIMNLLRLEDSLAKRLGLTESQPRVDQLMIPIHHSSDQRVIGASSLSLSLDVSTLTGTEVISATIDTPTAPSTTLAFVSTITPISIEDYEVAGTDGQEAVNESVPNDATGGNVNPFPNVDDVELNVSQ
ncbi:hypothetical protein Tco_0796043 [Tanacetum coccineum]